METDRNPWKTGCIYNFEKREKCSPSFVLPFFSFIVHIQSLKGKKKEEKPL